MKLFKQCLGHSKCSENSRCEDEAKCQMGAVRGACRRLAPEVPCVAAGEQKRLIYKQEEKNVKTKRAPGEHLRENSKERKRPKGGYHSAAVQGQRCGHCGHRAEEVPS